MGRVYHNMIPIYPIYSISLRGVIKLQGFECIVHTMRLCLPRETWTKVKISEPGVRVLRSPFQDLGFRV